MVDRAENGDEKTEGESMGSILICGAGNETITSMLIVYKTQIIDVLRSMIRPRHGVEEGEDEARMRLASRNCLLSKVPRLAPESPPFGASYVVECVPYLDG